MCKIQDTSHCQADVEAESDTGSPPDWVVNQGSMKNCYILHGQRNTHLLSPPEKNSWSIKTQEDCQWLLFTLRMVRYSQESVNYFSYIMVCKLDHPQHCINHYNFNIFKIKIIITGTNTMTECLGILWDLTFQITTNLGRNQSCLCSYYTEQKITAL